jgi:hypothetical protein
MLKVPHMLYLAFEAASAGFSLVLAVAKQFQTIVMLKRLSEAISQSNIEGKLQASDTHCSQHSSCNFISKSLVVSLLLRSVGVLHKIV